MPPVLILGCGDIGRRLAALHAARGRDVLGVVRSAISARALQGPGIQALALDLDREPAPRPAADALVYYLAPPPRDGETDTRLRAVLAGWAETPPRRIVYISTTAVYGDCGGEWVDETRPPAPGSARGRRRLDAEQALTAFADRQGTESVILRVAGIYGPGRLPLARLREGMRVICPQEAPPSNRIHAQDLAEVCLAAGARARAGRVYNVSDGRPSSMTEYFYTVADLAGLPRPPCVPYAQAEAELGPGMWAFLSESRRLDSRRMLNELGITLRYPELADGLRASLADDQSLV